MALLSAFFNALCNIARRTHGSLAQPAELAWWTLVFSLPLGLGLFLLHDGPAWTSNDYLIPAIAAAVINTYGHILIFRAYKYADASVISPISNLVPISMLVSSFLFLGSTPTLYGLVGILFVVSGLYYSSVSGKHSLAHPFQSLLKNRGSRAMLTWVLLMAFMTALMKIALDSAATGYLMLFLLVCEFTILSVYLLIRPAKHRFRHGERVLQKWGWHIAAIAVFATLSVFFQLEAMKIVDPSYVLSIKRLDVLITILLAGAFLGERHIMRRLKGSVFALVGVAIIYLAA